MRRKQIIIMGVGSLCLLGLAASLLIPRYLVQEATQAPDARETGTFVTRQSENVDLNQKLQESLLAAGLAVQAEQPDPDPPAEPHPPATEEEVSRPGTQAPPPDRNTDDVIWRSPPRHSAPETPAETDAPPPEALMPTESPPERSVQARRSAVPPASETLRQPARPQPQAFEVSMSEAEVSNLVYGQLQRGIDPRYRQALQGVSTRIQQGKARVTVALLPKHLPDGFLKNLPGVTPSTPTVYLGGEMSLYQQGSRVVADVHHISLGNFKVPLPFIQSAVRSQVEVYSQQMLRLPDGRQAELYSVALDQGALTLTGIVN